MPRRRVRVDDDDLDSEVDKTFDALEKDALVNRRGSRRVSAALRTQKDEDEERQKILMDMNARSIDKENPAKNERMLEAMKIAVTKAKQLAARAFQEDLIDKLPIAVEKEPLYQAGSLLDASARIYSFRVDATHSEAYDVRQKLGEKFDKGSKKDTPAVDDDGEMNSDNEEENAGKKEGKDKTKKKGEADEMDIDSDIDLEDGTAKNDDVYDVDDLPVYNEDPESGTEDEQIVLEPSAIVKKFTNRYDKSHENCVKRRSKVPMVVYDSSELNDNETGAEFCSHLYSKATHNFDEGSASGLLMQNAITSKCGRRYMLHNNCRCSRDPYNEKNEGEELHEIWSSIEDAERIGHHHVASTAPSSVHDDEQMSTPSQNITASQDTFMDTTACTSNMQSIQKNVEAVLEEALQESGSKVLFRWRRRLQKKFGLGTEQFIALLAHSLRDMDPFVKRSFIRQAIIPERKSYISRIADTKSGLTYAPIADELEPFEESFSWKVCRMRWDAMSNEARSKMLKAVPGEHSTYNYFFARSSEQLSTEGDNVLGNLPVFRSIVEIEVPRDVAKMRGDDQKALAGVLDTFRIGRGESLFKKKGDDFGRKIAQIPIATPTPMKRPEQQAHWERESTASKEQPRSTVPSESAYGRSTAPSRMDDVDSEMDAGGFNTSFDNDADVDSEMASSRLGDFKSVTDDVRSVTSKQTELTERPDSVQVEGSLRSERTDAASAYGDLHFVDEKRVAIMAYSIVNDETHWKKRKLDKEDAAVATKGRNTTKLDRVLEKVERKKAKREEEKELFEIGDFDNMPLAVIRDRQRQTKRPTVLVKREDEVLKVPRARVAAELLYKPEQFCRLAHVFSGEWDKVRFHRSASMPTDGKERLSVRQSIRQDLEPEDAIREHMSHFNDYFDDSCSERRPASVPCSSEAYDARNTDDDLFSEPTQDDDNESMMVAPYVIPTMSTTHSFYSEADSGAEEAEIFGVKYSVRQRRINAPAVKRAIGTILSNAELDADSLNAELSAARQEGMSNLEGMKDLSIVTEETSQNSLLLSSQDGRVEMSAEEEQLQLREEEEMNDDPTCELRHAEIAVKDFRLAGRHTFSSVLAQLPSYLAGRTADDLSPINAFSVLLHLCNENNLELLQRKDDHGLIKPTEMGDFTIISARKKKVNRKRTASESR